MHQKHMSVTKRYRCECAHYLPNVPDTHKCKRMHGHNYAFEITLVAPVGYNPSLCLDRAGFVVDFFDIDTIMQPIIAIIDHRVLNDIEGLSNPSAENIAIWLYDKVMIASDHFENSEIVRVRVYETDDCYAELYIYT